MDEILAFGREYGWLALLTAWLLLNVNRILPTVERVIGKVWPTFDEARRLAALRAEERNNQVRVERDRVDTVLALKDMLLAYRQSLDDMNLERRQLQNRLYDLVERYERHDAQFIEALRDISDAIRAQTERLDRLSVKVGGNHDLASRKRDERGG
jgi:hypothetical protein